MVLQGEIMGKFEKLTEHYVESRQLEIDCNDLQYRYDNLILRYAGIVGNENIPAGLLEHCSRVIAEYDNENDEILLTLEDHEMASPEEQSKTEEKPELAKGQLAEVELLMNSITKFIRKNLDELQ